MAGTNAGTAAEANNAAQLASEVTQVGTWNTALEMAAGGGSVQFGTDGEPATDSDYVGQDNGPGHRSGIQSLMDAESVSIIAAPGQTVQDVQDALITQCETLLNRVAVLDGEQDPAGGSVNAILAHRDNYDTSYAAYYVPWL